MRLVAKLPIIWELLMDKINNKKKSENKEKIDPHHIIHSLINTGLYNCYLSTWTDNLTFCDIISAQQTDVICQLDNLVSSAWQRGSSTNSKASDNQRESNSLFVICNNQPHTRTHTPAARTRFNNKKEIYVKTLIHKQAKKWAIQVNVPIHTHTLIPW